MINIINKLNTVGTILYLTPRASRGFLFEDYLHNYEILTNDNGYQKRIAENRGVKVKYFEDNTSLSARDLVRNKDSKFIEYINNIEQKKFVMLFKSQPNPGNTVYGCELINPSYESTSSIEDKISFFNNFKNTVIGEYFPKKIIISTIDKGITYKEMVGQFDGNKFVVQLNKSHSGDGTYIIENEDEYTDLVNSKLSGFPCKISQYIDSCNQYFTINAVATKWGTYIAGLSNQITAIKEINASKGETCGNNFNQNGLSDTLRNELVKITDKVGSELYVNNGFWGMFGIDFVIDENNNVYIIEVNARQTASVQDFTKIQDENGVISLPLIHLAEYFNIDPMIDRNEYNYINTLPQIASILVLRNHNTENILIKNEYNGLYLSDGSMKLIEKNAYSINDVYSTSNIFINENSKGSVIQPRSEFCRIIGKSDFFEGNNILHNTILNIVREIYNGTEII